MAQSTQKAVSALLLLLFYSSFSPQAVFADGFVGCLFNKAVCRDAAEWCFNDHAFGRCLLDSSEPGERFTFDLKKEALTTLEREMDRLFQLGYRWTHLYTQCIFQSVLAEIRYEVTVEDQTCRTLTDQDLTLDYKTEEGLPMKPTHHKDLMAYVDFTPSMGNPNAEYADEVYSPVFGDPVEVEGDSPQLDKPKRGRGKEYRDGRGRRVDGELEGIEGLKGINEEEVRLMEEIAEAQALQQLLSEETQEEPEQRSHFSERYNIHTPDNFRQGLEARDFLEELEGPVSQDRSSSAPGAFREQPLQGNFAASPEDRQFVYENYRGDGEESDLRDLAAVINQNGRSNGGNVEGVYTEGGMMYLKEPEKDEEQSEAVLEDLVNNYNNIGWGFKRPERLDVKKPGPAFATNNYAFQDEEKEAGKKGVPEKPAVPPPPQASPTSPSTPSPPPLRSLNLRSPPEKKKVGSPMESPSLRKPQVPPDDNETPHDPVDASFTYIQFKNSLGKWEDGARIVRQVAKLLNIDPNNFSHTRVDGNEVTFKVEPNRLGLNASEVARRIDGIKDRLDINGQPVGVISAGVGDKTKHPSVFRLSREGEHQLWILSFLLCGVIAAVCISGAALFVIRRHANTRDKLQNLTQPDTEASKDYQDLCRARMAAKTVEKPEAGAQGQRISNLTRESESNQSPSSRSSTSSWSEEPALTNMDISTGHMVLSYMEDHLKNKDRLEQEWVALCAYEAEPCATAIALKPENSNKNRYNDVLPYDHARVVLNELANLTGSDYINASTITDHDPRNPAYIATQGPLPQTAADLWQMVWEQGSVVMVMLTRLTETGSAMCHRYWPEEGSELYHIYEVHLVSEHVWCDDYLVRSFYLKNLKTGETRTVTQFHFLSWPENGVPLSTKALLEFRRKVNKSYRGRSCPIVVHCSDGVGRSGTYCLIDMVLNRMAKGAKEIDIAATLEHIRDQRPLMVRSKQQFEFVLMAVAEEVHAILKALPANHSPPPVLKEKE